MASLPRRKLELSSRPHTSWLYNYYIPKNLKAGNYLLRTEVINLQNKPAQFFPNCAQITVTGEGTAFPEKDWLVSFPGAYNSTGE